MGRYACICMMTALMLASCNARQEKNEETGVQTDMVIPEVPKPESGVADLDNRKLLERYAEAVREYGELVDKSISDGADNIAERDKVIKELAAVSSEIEKRRDTMLNEEKDALAQLEDRLDALAERLK